MRIFGTILAGGEARRMGSDKALMPLAGRPLVAWVADRFAPQVEELALSANGDPGEVCTAWPARGYGDPARRHH